MLTQKNQMLMLIHQPKVAMLLATCYVDNIRDNISDIDNEERGLVVAEESLYWNELIPITLYMARPQRFVISINSFLKFAIGVTF